MSINHVTLSGRLTADPVLRKTSSDKSVASFTLAVDRPRAKDSDSDMTDFFNCVAWNGTADAMGDYTSKGSLVSIEGRLQTRKYQDRQGNNRIVTEVICSNVVFMDSKKKSRETYMPAAQSQYTSEIGRAESVNEEYSNGIDIDTDDLPF